MRLVDGVRVRVGVVAVVRVHASVRMHEADTMVRMVIAIRSIKMVARLPGFVRNLVRSGKRV